VKLLYRHTAVFVCRVAGPQQFIDHRRGTGTAWGIN